MVLIAALFFAVVLAGLSWVFLQSGLRQRGDVDQAEHLLRAREIAEHALLRAEMELVAQTDPAGDGCGTLSGRWMGGSYEARCTADPAATTRYVLTVTAYAQLSRADLEAGVKLHPSGLFTHALFGTASVKLTGGSHTDSYDSEQGAWSTQVTLAAANAPGGAYVGTHGDVGSNGEIVLSGPVRGDAIPGTGFVVDHGEEAWGSTTPRTEGHVLEPTPIEDFAAAFADNDNASIDVSNEKVSYDAENLVLLSGGGAPITLTGGTYIFNTLKMTGGGSLYVTGPTKIYITNYFEISGGGIANVTGNPRDCIIHAHPYDFPAESSHDKRYVKTSGGSDTALAVYAPLFDLEVSGGGTFYGALAGRTVVFSGGSAFHYDEALGRFGGETSRIERLYLIQR